MLAGSRKLAKLLKEKYEDSPNSLQNREFAVSSNNNQKHTYDYPRPALTVDIAIVTREANPRVLLIRRKREPFAASWALPGGFVDENEKLADAARRELVEETGVAVADLEQLYTAGDPGRDPRGWTVSVAYLAQVDPGALKPVAADDAEAVAWFTLDSLPPLAFDHAMLLARVRTRLADRLP
jgi:8-oxo-dGTP diphosphatase